MPSRAYTCQQLGEIGMLGNQLFQVAGTITRCLRNRKPGCSPALYPDWPFRPYVSIPDGFFRWPNSTELVVDCEGYMQDKDFALGDAYIPFEHPDSWHGSLWRSLQPSPYAIEEGKRFYRYGEELERTAAIHVRRNDYLLYPDVFAKLDADYYKAALDKLMESGKPFDQFMLFSDDIEMAMNELVGIGYELLPVQRIEDPYECILNMQLMSRCGGFVIANSTYSWWAARLSKSENVVMPSRWGVDRSPLGIEFQGRAKTLKVSWWKQV